MPHGYKEYLRKQNKSEYTIDENIRQIEYFFKFLDNKHKGKTKELVEITNKDIKDYFKFKETTLKESSINKLHSILKSFFHYLWVNDIVKSDPMYKLERVKIKETNREIISYENLLKIKSKVLNNQEYTLQRKIIFILSLHALRPLDFHIQKDDIKINGDIATIKVSKRLIQLDKNDSDYFIEYFFQTQFNSSPYLLVTKSKDKETRKEILVPIERMSIYTNLWAVATDHDISKFTLNDLRFAYAHYLTGMGNSIEDIANILGIENSSAAILINECKSIQFS